MELFMPKVLKMRVVLLDWWRYRLVLSEDSFMIPLLSPKNTLLSFSLPLVSGPGFKEMGNYSSNISIQGDHTFYLKCMGLPVAIKIEEEFVEGIKWLLYG